MLKQIKDIIESSKPEYCHEDSVRLFIRSSYKSTIAYLASLTLYLWAISDFLPPLVLSAFVGAHTIYLLARFYIVFQYKEKCLSDQKIKQQFQRINTLLMFLGGVNWGVGSFLCVLYAPTPNEYIILALLVGMAAGSISTLNPLFRVYVAYNLPMMLLLIFSFLYIGDQFHSFIALMLGIFTTIVILASWDMHVTLKRNIELRELYAKAQEELKQINSSLEERIQQEVEQNRAKDQQMLEQSRLAQMGEMLSMIAHQWRQPLSAITATTGSITLHLALEEKCNPELIEESVEKINTYTQYLSTTISDFRNFFKPDKEMSLTTLEEVVSDSLSIIGSSLESHGIELGRKVETASMVLTYPNELKQVVLNILKNAQDIFVEKRIETPKIMMHIQQFEEMVELSIHDNAGGVKPEHLKQIFDPYFTTKHQSDGTGLGLYMSKMIVEDHCKGTLEVANVDDGACFYLRLPVHRA